MKLKAQLVCSLMLLICLSALGQQTPPRPAEFPGGMDNFYKWVDRNLVYPEDAKEKDIEGTVIVSFTIKEDGTVWEESLTIAQSVCPSIDAEAIRLFKESPRWIPARTAEKGEAVAVKMSVPLNFWIAL